MGWGGAVRAVLCGLGPVWDDCMQEVSLGVGVGWRWTWRRLSGGAVAQKW